MANETDMEFVPQESPSTEIAHVEKSDPETLVEEMEKRANLAPRMIAAMRKILMLHTLPTDWTEFPAGAGKEPKMCLSSAGAERVATEFAITFSDVKFSKEDWKDDIGRAYRYVFEGYAEMRGRKVFAQGIYSTRDKFLGKAQGEYKDILEINENDVRTAAYHIFMGNGIKALLGLRSLPKSLFDKIYTEAGIKSDTAGKATFASGTKGGSSVEETQKQNQLLEMLTKFANNGFVIEFDGTNHKAKASDNAKGHSDKAAIFSLEQLTKFVGKDDEGNPKTVNGVKDIKQLKAKRLDFAFERASKIINQPAQETVPPWES